MKLRILLTGVALLFALQCGGGFSNNNSTSTALLLGMATQISAPAGEANIQLRLNLGQTAASAPQGAQATATSDVTRVTVEINGTDIAAPIFANLTQNGELWTGTIPNIPVGTDRTFIARAYDVNDALLYEGQSTSITIVFNQTAQIQIQMQESNPAAAFSNVAPYIQTFAMSSATILPGDTVSFAVTAIDDNVGDILTYAWTADGGVFDDATSSTPIWTGPTPNGAYTISVQITDPTGALASMSVTTTVDSGTGSGGVGVEFNNTPVVTNMSALPTRIDVSETTNIAAIVTDADNDVLDYTWTSDCGGVFGDNKSISTTFSAPASYPANNQCTLTITVDDSNGGVNTGSLTINVRAPVVIDPIVIPDTQAPTITALSLSPTTVDTTSADQTITLTITIEDNQALPDGINLNFNAGLVSAAGTQYLSFIGSASQMEAGGTATNRTFIVTADMPQFAQGGVWTLQSVYVVDAVGNNAILSGAQLMAQGFSNTVTNTSTAADSQAPTLSALSFSKTTIDTTNAADSFNITAGIADNQELPGTFQLNMNLSLTSPSGTQYVGLIASTEQMEAGGTDTARSFVLSATLPQYAESGIWTVASVTIRDAVGNTANLTAADLISAGLPTTINNTATVSDTTAPVISALIIDTPTVSTNGGPATVTMTITVTDDFALPLGQFDLNLNLSIVSPTAGQYLGFIASTSQMETGGTDTNRTFVLSATMPQGSETGDWAIGSIFVRDSVGNNANLTAADLTTAGFPTIVTNQ